MDHPTSLRSLALLLGSVLLTASSIAADSPREPLRRVEEADLQVDSLRLPRSLHIDGLHLGVDGRLYLAGSYFSDRVWSLDPEGELREVARGLAGPIHVVQRPSDRHLLVSCFKDGTVVEIDRQGNASTLASGFDGPGGLALDAEERLYVANWGVQGAGGNRIDRVHRDGRVEPWVEGEGIHTPLGLLVRPDGTLLVANSSDGRILAVDPDDRRVTEWARVPRAPTRWALGHMVSIGDRIVISGNFRHVLYEIDPGGEARILAGADLDPGTVDGDAAQARLFVPNGLAWDAENGTLWVASGGGKADRELRRIRL